MTTYYVDPADGDDANSGTSLDDALASFAPVETDGRVTLEPGDTVELRDTAVLYPPSKPVWYETAGTPTDRITIRAHGDERPVIDCSNYDDHGIDLWGVQHVTWRGIEIRNVGKNGILCAGTDSQAARDCVFERMEIHHYGTVSEWNGNGLVFYGRSYDHTVRDVVAHHGGDNGDSDGFYVGGSTSAGRSGGHTFVRCEAYRNANDGFDFFDTDPARPSTLIDCVAHHNGDDGAGATGDGNGFKLGGGWGTGGNSLERCLAYENVTRGFDCNGASERNEFVHCTAWNNGTYGFHFTGGTGQRHDARNCASFGNGTQDVGALWNADTTHNTWDLGIEEPSFVATDPDSADFLRPAADSPLVGAGAGGTDGDDAPDVGAVPATVRTTGSTASGDVAVGDGGSVVESGDVDDAWTGATLRLMRGGTRRLGGSARFDGDPPTVTEIDVTADASMAAYAGDTGSFAVTSSGLIAGGGSLESSSAGAVWRTDVETAVGTTYETRVRQGAGTYAQVLCFVDDASRGKADVSGYGVEVDFGPSEELSVVRYDDGSAWTLASTPCEPRPGQWNRISVAVDCDGVITAAAVDADGTEFATVSATDTTYTSGRLGFGADNAAVGFDDLRRHRRDAP